MELKEYLMGCKSNYELRVGLCLLLKITNAKDIIQSTGIDKSNVYRALRKIYTVSPQTPGVSIDTKNVVRHRKVGVPTDTKPVSPQTPSGVSPDTSPIYNNINKIREEKIREEKRRKEKKECIPKIVCGKTNIPKPIEFKKPSKTPSLETCRNYFARHGSTYEEGERFFNWYEAKGWKGIEAWIFLVPAWIEKNKNRGTQLSKEKPRTIWQSANDLKLIEEYQSERRRLIKTYELDKPGETSKPHKQVYANRVVEIEKFIKEHGKVIQN